MNLLHDIRYGVRQLLPANFAMSISHPGFLDHRKELEGLRYA